MRKDLMRMAAIGALEEVGATPEESDLIIANEQLLNEMTTWPEHRLWARTTLIRLRARDAEIGKT